MTDGEAEDAEQGSQFDLVNERLLKVPMKRIFLLTNWKDLLKWFCKLFYSFSFTCFVVELFRSLCLRTC